MRLTYLANARLPTEKAHGLQIVRMCEAFAGLGVSTTLLHPARYQPGTLGARDIHQYYDSRRRFPIHTLSNIDVVRAEPWLPTPVFIAALFAHAWLWAHYAVAKAVRIAPGDIYMTREIPIAASLLRRRLPTILEVHKAPERWSLRLLRHIAKDPSLRLLITMTKELRGVLVERGISPRPFTVLHDGVDLERFRCAATFLWQRDLPIVLYAGQLFAEKGIETLVQAARFLEGVEIKVLGGMPHHVEAWRSRVATEGPGNVEFLGHWEPKAVPGLQKAADLLVLPNSARHPHSARYTSPMKLFEYMAAGRAIIASDVPAIREVLRHGENAWLVPPDNPIALADGVRTLLNDGALRERLAARGQMDVQRYTWRSRANLVIQRAGFSIDAASEDAANF